MTVRALRHVSWPIAALAVALAAGCGDNDTNNTPATLTTPPAPAGGPATAAPGVPVPNPANAAAPETAEPRAAGGDAQPAADNANAARARASDRPAEPDDSGDHKDANRSRDDRKE
jgi:hypothetical protein